MTQLLVAVSLGLQLLNIWLTVRLIAITGKRLAWLFIASAMVITAIRRVMTLYQIRAAPELSGALWEQELLGVVIAGLLAVGLVLIRPIFESLRRAELVSRQSEEQYRSLFEYSPLPIVICHAGRIQYANRSSLSILGADNLNEIAGRPFISFCNSADRGGVEQSLAALRENQLPGAMTELTLVRTDGRPIEVEAVITLFLYGGTLAQYIMMWDVSGRKRKEEQLRAREAELALVNRRQTMGEIAGELAHEVNQPLYAVCNFAEAGLLHLDAGDAKQLPAVRNCLQQAHAQATRAAQIVKNLRNFVGSHEEHLSLQSLNRLVYDAFELVAIEARRQRVMVDFQLSPNEPRIRVDRVQLEQVVVNLLLNAFEALAALPAESRRVLVTTMLLDGQAILEVSDRGPGIPADVRQRIFEPFFSTKATGMGMGLAICRTIATQYGGKIEAVPGSPIGATFRVSLPHAED